MSVSAIYFDIPGTPQEDKWSVATFGEELDSERCHGIVLKVLSGGQFARVRWGIAIDGRSQRVCVANLQLEAEDGGLEPPAEEGRVFQPLSYSSSSDALDKESSSFSDSDDDASESEDESDIQSQSASGGGERDPSQPQPSNAKRKKSPAEVDHNKAGKVTTAHGLEWMFVDDVSVDAYKDYLYKPKLRVADPASMSVLDFWLLSFSWREHW